MKHQALFHGDLVNTARIIYTPSEFAKTSLLHIQEIGTLQAQKPHVSKREDLDSYLFFMVRSGSGELHYAHNTYPLGVGDCVFIDCRSAYFHETKDDLWSLSWVHFNGPSIDGIYQKYKERGGLPAFHANAFSLYEDCFNHLYSIVSGNSYVRDMQINEGLSALLTLLMEDSWHPDSMPAHTKRTSLWHVREYLDQNYAQKNIARRSRRTILHQQILSHQNLQGTIWCYHQQLPFKYPHHPCQAGTALFRQIRRRDRC